MGNWFFGEKQNNTARLDELDARLTRRDEIISLLWEGHMTQAIKVYREDTAASRHDAKAAVERMELGLRQGQPVASLSRAESDAERLHSSAESADLRAEVMGMVAQGQKIAAIKRYRQRTGVGLREAMEALERLESDPDSWQGERHGNITPPEPDVSASSDEIERLVLMGQKINAIKMYRQMTGLGLREAKEAIDQMEYSLRQEGRATFLRLQDQRPELPLEAPGTETLRYLQAGQKIQAIKAYRAQTGLSLKDAKDGVERLEQIMRAGFFFE